MRIGCCANLNRQIYPPTVAELEQEFTVHKLWTAADPERWISEHCDRVRAVVTTGLAGFTRAQIDALPRLELIACFSKRPAGIDVAYARARGIVVTGVPWFIAVPVAELAFSDSSLPS